MTSPTIAWLQGVDVALLRFINISLTNPVCDALVRLVAQKWLLIPLFLVPSAIVLWRGNRGKWLFLTTLVFVMATGDSLIFNGLKKAIGRPRPVHSVSGLTFRLGKGRANSMPSSHAANWFAVAMVCGWFWRRSWWVLGPTAATVAFTRVYAGSHYPSDVVVGALVGMAWAWAGIWLVTFLWRRLMPATVTRVQPAPVAAVHG